MKTLIILLGCMLLAGAASAKDTLIWMRLDFPPSFVANGPDQGMGYSDVAMQIAIRSLPEYTHETAFVNPPKAIQNLRTQNNFCGSGLNRNAERETFMEFSIPFIKRLPNQLVILKETLPRLRPYIEANGRVDFARLINDDSLKMGFHKERSYGASIDPHITEKPRAHLIHRPANDLTLGFLHMLKAQEIDYIIESPDSLRYFQRRGNYQGAFWSLPIKDAEGLLPVYFACPKSALGKQIIRKIDTIIQAHQSEFESAYRYWVSDESRTLPQVEKHQP
ncbi:MAG: TIGR02285 family protein [Rhodocyclaceae bacterium]|nr:TIGR02285 family protein [Rhodocyclaceae bacterium]MDZ4214362.1 TIGR02285 family protein [Rhodocyclaceae bacterium]